MTPTRDLYKLLQVDPEAEAEIIVVAYKRLASKYHPDVNPSPDAHKRMRDINAAYEVLGDAQRRAAYDARRRPPAERPRRASRAAAAPPPSQPQPALIISPHTLPFGRVRKGAFPSAKLEIGVTEGRVLIGEIWTSAPWIRLSVNRLFSDRTAVQVSVDTSEMDEGRHYAGSIVVESVVFGSRKVAVSLQVAASAKPALRVYPSLLDFGRLRFGQPPKVLELDLGNTGAGYLTGTLDPRQDWLSVSQTEFAGNDITLQVMASADGLPAGQIYNGEINIDSNGGSALVMARLEVMPDSREAAPAPAPTVAGDIAFLQQRMGILEGQPHPTEEQRQERAIIGYLLRTCTGGGVGDAIRRGIAAAQGAESPGWRNDQGVLQNTGEAATVLAGLLERLGRWQESAT